MRFLSKNVSWVRPAGAALGIVLCGLFTSCVNEDLQLYEVRLRGEVKAPALSRGVLHLEFHVAQTLAAAGLGHPLGLIDARTLPMLQPVDETIAYPLSTGEGLVVYGWLDSDGDGRLCAPGAALEPAGVVKVPSALSHEMSFQLVLDRVCAGAEGLFP